MSDISGISAYQTTAAATAAGTTGAASEGSQDFAQIISDAMQSELQQSAVTLSGSTGLEGYDDLAGSGLESMLLASAATGEVDEEQVALFMLLMLMQSSEDSGGSSQLMGLMATVLTQMQQD